MPAIPGAKLGAETGLQDANWIADVRDALRDYPQLTGASRTGDSVNGVVGAGGGPFIMPQKPLYDGGVAPYVPACTVNGVAQTLSATYPPATGQFYVNYNTGEWFFPTAPGTVPIVFSYPFVHWSDQAILTALYAGLRMMFPKVGKTYVDNTIQIQVNVWDYTLPSYFSDPRSAIVAISVIDPDIPTEPYRPLTAWKRVGLDKISIPHSQRYSPVARLRISGWGPYLNLGDLEPQLYHLPVWYACSTLLAKQEAVRDREDTTVPVTQEGGTAPMMMLNTAKDFERRFNEALTLLSRTYGPGFKKRGVTSYDLNHYGPRG